MSLIEVRNGSPFRIPVDEIFGFLGTPHGAAREELLPTVCDVAAELEAVMTPRICYAVYDYVPGDLGFAKTESVDITNHLSGCRRLILLAATVGIAADRLTAKYAPTSTSRSVMLHAAGSAAIETWLDRFTLELEAEFGELTPRFSCGYGDLPLELQRNIFSALNPEKNIGVCLNSSLLMTPTKSVTAIIGIRDNR